MASSNNGMKITRYEIINQIIHNLKTKERMRNLSILAGMLICFLCASNVNAQTSSTPPSTVTSAAVTKKYKGFSSGTATKPCKGICIFTCYIEETTLTTTPIGVVAETKGYDENGMLLHSDLSSYEGYAIEDAIVFVSDTHNVEYDTPPETTVRRECSERDSFGFIRP